MLSKPRKQLTPEDVIEASKAGDAAFLKWLEEWKEAEHGPFFEWLREQKNNNDQAR